MRDILSGMIDLSLRVDGGETLARQLYGQLRGAILSGALPAGQRLPSSRDLAQHLEVSRNTVSLVVDQLAMEGYLDVAQGRRPTVAVAAPPALASGAPVAHAGSPGLRISRREAGLAAADWPFLHEGPPRPFMPCAGDARAFPHDVWARCLRRAARGPAAGGAVAGATGSNRPRLQAALLRHLAEHRGCRAEPHQILITPSAQSAIALIARVMLDPGDLAWVESPGYGGAALALHAAGATVRGVGLDAGGIAFAGRTDRPRLIFVTPSHQYPTGGLMPVARRQELLAFAAGAGAAIIEDDYDAEFHYEGRPVAALQGLDRSGSVFYVGTFSKSTFADIRVGYAIVPEGLVEAFERAQRGDGQIVAGPLQDALAEFIDDGHFAAHIRKMSRIYRGRRDLLVAALNTAAGNAFHVEPPAGGMQLLVTFEDGGAGRDDRVLSALLAQAGVTARPLSRHFTGEVTGQGLFLGFAAWNEQEIAAGAAAIGKVLQGTR